MALYTIGVALRNVMVDRLGITESELGVLVDNNPDTKNLDSGILTIYDTASQGAGFSSQFGSMFPSILQEAHDFLVNCSTECAGCCHSCLLDFATQHKEDNLDRHVAIAILGHQNFTAMQTPLQSQLVFGEDTRYEGTPVEPLLKSMFSPEKGTIFINLSALSDATDFESWELRKVVFQAAIMGQEIHLLFDQDPLKHHSLTSHLILFEESGVTISRVTSKVDWFFARQMAGSKLGMFGVIRIVISQKLGVNTFGSQNWMKMKNLLH